MSDKANQEKCSHQERCSVLLTEPVGASPGFDQLPAGQPTKEVGLTAFPLANENVAATSALREPRASALRLRIVRGTYLERRLFTGGSRWHGEWIRWIGRCHGFGGPGCAERIDGRFFRWSLHGWCLFRRLGFLRFGRRRQHFVEGRQDEFLARLTHTLHRAARGNQVQAIVQLIDQVMPDGR